MAKNQNRTASSFAVKTTMVAAGLVALITAPVHASEISKINKVKEGNYFVSISGTINPDDENIFERVTAGDTLDIVFLAGPGGNEIAGLKIGEMIRNRHFYTAVGSGVRP